MIPHLDLLQRIWDNGNKEGVAYLATLDRINGHGFQESEAYLVDYQPHGCDLFFTPLRFSYKRSNKNAVAPSVLFADLDGAPTPEPDLRPTIYWETSTGNTQAIWFLGKPEEDYDKWADLNRRMTYHTKADRGGWMGSKLLRVPESVNWKRRSFGRLLWDDGPAYTFEYLDAKLPHLGDRTPSPQEDHHPLLPVQKVSYEALINNWDKLTLRGRSLVMRTTVSDRSMHIVRTANELAACGIDHKQAFIMMWNRPWNKWRHHNNPSRLWQEITACDVDPA